MNATKTVTVMDYATGDSIGDIEVSGDYWKQYADCTHPAFEWPNGVARAEDVLDDDAIESLGIEPKRVIWLN